MHEYYYPDWSPNAWGYPQKLSLRARKVPYQQIQPKPYTHPLWFKYQSIEQYGTWLSGRNPAYNRSISTFVEDWPWPVNGRISEEARQWAIAQVQNDWLTQVGEIRVNLLDMFRTRKETIDMVTKKMFTLVTAYRHLKKGRWRKFCQTLGFSAKKPKKGVWNAPGLWLEYSFGWSPLISDVYTMINKTFEPPEAYVRRVVRLEKQVPFNYLYPSYETCNLTQRIRACATGYVFVDSPAIAAASQYGILNPAAVAWEAIPFSFVIDWFAPVGDYLNSFSQLAGLKVKDFSITYKEQVIGTVTKTVWFSSNPYDMISGNARINSIIKDRQVTEPQWLWPGSKPDLGLQRTSYALSLLASIFSSRR